MHRRFRQGANKLLSAPKPCPWLLRQGLIQNGPYLGMESDHGRRLVNQMTRNDLRAAPLERRMAGQELVGHDAQRVEICTLSRFTETGVELLWCHVGECSRLLPRAGQSALGLRLGQAKIGQSSVTISANDNVRWLDVPVDHAVSVGIVQGHRHLIQRTDCQLRGHGTLPGDKSLQWPPIEQFHHDEQALTALSDIMDHHDVGVPQARGDARLAIKALDKSWVRQQLWVDYLNRHLHAQVGVQGTIDNPEPTPSQFFDDLIFP